MYRFFCKISGVLLNGEFFRFDDLLVKQFLKIIDHYMYQQIPYLFVFEGVLFTLTESETFLKL